MKRRTKSAAKLVKKSGRRLDDREDEEPQDHLWLASVAVGPPPEDRLEDELGEGPGGDDQAQLRSVDAVLLGEERQHR